MLILPGRISLTQRIVDAIGGPGAQGRLAFTAMLQPGKDGLAAGGAPTRPAIRVAVIAARVGAQACLRVLKLLDDLAHVIFRPGRCSSFGVAHRSLLNLHVRSAQSVQAPRARARYHS